MDLTYVEIPLLPGGRTPWTTLDTPTHGILTIQERLSKNNHAVVAYVIDDSIHIAFDPSTTGVVYESDRFVSIGFVVKAAKAPPPA
jgi:hypothetical protein